jgi:nondiscriminating aspartyl-tRNA synthetase
MENRRIRTTTVREHVGEHVVLCGWLHAIRRIGRLAFVVLRDGWGTVQIVATAGAREPLERQRAGPESVLRVRGRLVANPEAPGGVELVEPVFEVLVAVSEPLPVPLVKGLDQAKLPALLDHAPTVLRAPSRRATLQVAAGAMRGFRQRLVELGFTEIQTPKIVAAATESGANVFALDYFGETAYLAQSPQMYKQMMVGVFERVFEVGPVFRAEPHATVRHLSEYVSLDVEMGFIESHHEVIVLLREVLAGMLRTLQQECGEALATLGAATVSVPETLPCIDFAAARRKLAEAECGPEIATDLAPAEERWLGAWAEREHGSAWLVVTGYPMEKRPFYTHPDPERPGASKSFDLLFRGTELVTGGQRLHDHGQLVAAIESAGLSSAPFAAYLEAFRFGMPPHGGFAIGLERFVMQLIGLDNVRLATLFPRDTGRTVP